MRYALLLFVRFAWCFGGLLVLVVLVGCICIRCFVFCFVCFLLVLKFGSLFAGFWFGICELFVV